MIINFKTIYETLEILQSKPYKPLLLNITFYTLTLQKIINSAFILRSKFPPKSSSQNYNRNPKNYMRKN